MALTLSSAASADGSVHSAASAGRRRRRNPRRSSARARGAAAIRGRFRLQTICSVASDDRARSDRADGSGSPSSCDRGNLWHARGSDHVRPDQLAGRDYFRGDHVRARSRASWAPLLRRDSAVSGGGPPTKRGRSAWRARHAAPAGTKKRGGLVNRPASCSPYRQAGAPAHPCTVSVPFIGSRSSRSGSTCSSPGSTRSNENGSPPVRSPSQRASSSDFFTRMGDASAV